MKSIAVVVAVETYQAGGVKDVRFAGNDGKEMAEALTALGFHADGNSCLISGSATKRSVEAALQAAAAALEPGDAFYLYYAGHGFSEGAQNYLTCHDTELSDLVSTSLPLRWILRLLEDAGCGKIAFFLDSCHGLAASPGAAYGGWGDRSDAELREFFDAAEDRACFASAESGQLSWPSRRSRHGAWAISVIESFRGGAAGALADGERLTAASLQRHLGSAVQRTLSGDFVDRRDQTPWACGSVADDWLLADFGGGQAARAGAAQPAVTQVPRLAFCGETRQRIKLLSGFQKHRGIPTEASRYAESLARDASADEIVDDLESVYRRLREHFDFRRKDLEKVGPEDGGGSVVCPYFTYHVYVALDPSDPSRVVFHREVGDIVEPERLLENAFQGVFGGTFGALRFSPPVQINLDDFIDRMEALGDELLSLDFDPAGTHCQLRLAGVDALVKVTSTEIQLVHDTSKEPRVLIEAFFESQRFLAEAENVPLIRFDGPAA